MAGLEVFTAIGNKGQKIHEVIGGFAHRKCMFYNLHYMAENTHLASEHSTISCVRPLQPKLPAPAVACSLALALPHLWPKIAALAAAMVVG